MEGSPYRKFSISQGKGAILGPDPENSIAGNQGVPSSGDPGNWGSFQRGSRGRCLAWGLEAFLRQDHAPVIPRSLVPLRSGPYSEPGG
ncbi:hypothetical protein DY000_02052879 [Brassica cretica]|uniref:Uncharacterized protein n=1 Tax=Brassica cretica TaxID=69181 RepID=A0ABQ7A7S5_BRACR|nr:hypothetical protein DY000_02052879 [Brassica cretica]